MQNASFNMFKETKMQINKPSKIEMDRISALWAKEAKFENYEYEEKALEWLFKIYPANTELNAIIIKITCLDSFYGTNLTKSYKIHEVAQEILKLDFDSRVQKGDISLVDDLATFGADKGKPKILSFASKYCVWHNNGVYGKDSFVILDSIVKSKLKEFNKIYKFSEKFGDKDLENYAKYKEILECFRKFFGLQCSLREIDWYLWRLGKLEAKK